MRKTPSPLPAKPAAVTPAVNTTAARPASAKSPAAKSPAAKAPTIKASTAKASVTKAPAEKAVKAVAETPASYFAGAAGRAWRMSGKHAVAYVHTAALAGELLGAEPRRVAGSAMAVYYDRKGRPFAWQFRFDAARWAEVTGRLV